MKWHVLDAVFKRNFVAYFSNPTGYVFICVFVLLGSLAAFWPLAGGTNKELNGRGRCPEGGRTAMDALAL